MGKYLNGHVSKEHIQMANKAMKGKWKPYKDTASQAVGDKNGKHENICSHECGGSEPPALWWEYWMAQVPERTVW